jgi:hypothetical protein
MTPDVSNIGTGGASAIWGHIGGCMIITLSTGKKVDLNHPACLLGLTPDEYAELMAYLAAHKEVA